MLLSCIMNCTRIYLKLSTTAPNSGFRSKIVVAKPITSNFIFLEKIYFEFCPLSQTTVLTAFSNPLLLLVELGISSLLELFLLLFGTTPLVWKSMCSKNIAFNLETNGLFVFVRGMIRGSSRILYRPSSRRKPSQCLVV